MLVTKYEGWKKEQLFDFFLIGGDENACELKNRGAKMDFCFHYIITVLIKSASNKSN